MHMPLSTTDPVFGGAGFGPVNEFARDTGWLHPVAIAFAQYGVLAFAMCLITGWALARRAADSRVMARALLAGGGVLLAVAANQLLVHAVDEPRPYTRFPAALVLVGRSADASFPSDHAVMAGATAAGVLLVSRRLGAITAILALLMAADRVYVGAHYPIDVAAGLAVGAIVTLALSATLQTTLDAVLRRLTTSPLRPLVASGAMPSAKR